MPSRILWLSRHAPLASQITELRRLYGQDVAIKIDDDVFRDANELHQRLLHSGCDDYVIVAPLCMIKELVKRGLKPLRAVMHKVAARGEVISGGRHYIFIRFERITAITIETEEVNERRQEEGRAAS